MVKLKSRNIPDKPLVHIIHFNKIKQCWSVHVKGVCHLVNHLSIKVPMESRERPLKRANPRYFFTCRGYLTIKNNRATITSSKSSEYKEVNITGTGYTKPKKKTTPKKKKKKSTRSAWPESAYIYQEHPGGINNPGNWDPYGGHIP